MLATGDFPRHSGSGQVEGALQVKLRPGVSSADAAAALVRAGATELSRVDESNVRVVSVPAQVHATAARLLSLDPRVEAVEEDAVATAAVVPSDPYWGQQWNARRIRATEAWDATKGDPGITIAIVDTGVDSSQPDLRGRMTRGWDFQNNDGNPYDDDGHGTAVATTASAAGNDRVGIAGMCWRCKVMPVKVLNGQGHGSHSNIAAGVIWATDHGADVINMSIAGPSSTILLHDAVEYAIRRGVVVVAAAGNEGTSRRTYPAAYPGVISVAATNESDRLYSWSNRGSWVTLAAPGCAYSGRPHARWGWLCGTSLASPIVAGTVGLMLSLAPRTGRVRLTQMLTGNTQHVVQTARAGQNLAHGRLDAARALRSVLAAMPSASASDPTPPPPPSDPLRQGDYTWRGTLDAVDSWDRETYFVRGHVQVRVTWSGDKSLTMYVVHPSGRVFKRVEDDAIYFDMDVQGEEFTFTVQRNGSDAGTYVATIKYGVGD